VTVTLLSTTDIHGHIVPWDYYGNRPANPSLAKIATLVRQVRSTAPNALLLDCGDTIQGTPLAYYFAKKDTTVPNPSIAVMNAMGYDAMAVGNHEFNFGLVTLRKAASEAHFPFLAANIRTTGGATGGKPFFQPFIIKNVSGVRVALVGFITPGVPRWELPANYAGYTFEPIVDAAKRVIPEVRSKADLVVALVHSGLDRDPQTGQAPPFDQIPGENATWELAEQVPGIDIIFFGHTHQELPEKIINGVLLSQPKNWGGSLARADVEMDRDVSGHWRVAAKHSETIPATDVVPPDPEIMKIAEPYQEATQKYLDTPVATSAVALNGLDARVVDHPLVDLIHTVQMAAGQADVSMATMLFTGVRIPQGPVTVRQIAALYVYENTLYTVEMNGGQLRQILEHAASLLPAWPFPAGQPVHLPSYSMDSAEGVSYKIDLRRPVGDRIVDLKFRGKPLDPGQTLRVATNNYRYSGGGRYETYRGLPVVYRSPQEIRQLLIEYLSRTKTIPTRADNNWEIIPAEAREALVRQALAQGKSAGENSGSDSR
jgi:2',3'-cyclic-nucleotide 2'-phosphodiesterase / 3'-nucleotidase